MARPSLSPLSKPAFSFSLLSTFLFFLLTTPTPDAPNYPSPAPITPHRPLITTPAKTPPCSSTGHSNGLFNYLYLHFCLFRQNPLLSLSSLSLILLLLFYILIKTAQDHFSLVTTKLVSSLDLKPSMAAVTLLALGNGAPDAFASVAAVRTGQYRTGFGAILSAGTFVSAFVVAFVEFLGAPFSLNPAPFVRVVLFYLTAALFLFYVYLSAEIYLWQAVGFVGLVFWMDLWLGGGGKKSRVEVGLVGDCEMQSVLVVPDAGIGHVSESSEDGKRSFRFRRALGMISKAWVLPVSFLLKLTIPHAAPSEWSIFYSSAICSLPSSTSICLQFVHTIPSSCCFSPFQHPFASMVCNPLGNLRSCTSSLCSGKRAPQN